jgi:hypothetical protein
MWITQNILAKIALAISKLTVYNKYLILILNLEKVLFQVLPHQFGPISIKNL